MKKSKYKILVLSDLKKHSENTVKSTVSLAKMIGGEVMLFHVKKPTDVVERDNQLSTFRNINEQQTATKKGIENLINPICKANSIAIAYSYAFGNVKSEIEDYIIKNKPDIIVLGKRKSKSIGLIGDNITDFVLKMHKGVIMIASNNNPIELNQELSLGILHNQSASIDLEFSENLLAQAQKPLKAFSFINSDKEIKPVSDTTTVAYVFERNDNVIKNLSNYLSKSNIDLLYVDRMKNKNKRSIKKADIKEVINKLNVPLLLSAESKINIL